MYMICACVHLSLSLSLWRSRFRDLVMPCPRLSWHNSSMYTHANRNTCAHILTHTCAFMYIGGPASLGIEIAPESRSHYRNTCAHILTHTCVFTHTGGLASLGIEIAPESRSQYPRSRTCSNLMWLPNYASKVRKLCASREFDTESVYVHAYVKCVW